jgi:NAD-dependent dihydropyrimidine dehydrogenase PreA subunit
MRRDDKPDRGHIEILEEACKGCGLCVPACPPGVLALTTRLNSHGYHPVAYTGSGCTACGICYHACPEPSAITVFALEAPVRAAAAPPAALACVGQ